MIDAYLKKWLIKALEDITLVEHELRLPEEEVITSGVCFHAQQTVEKLLKSFLISQNVEFGRTHDLKLLLNLCRSVDADFNNTDVGNLTSYAVQVRYPDDFYIPTIDEAKESAEIAKDVMAFVFKKLGVDVEQLTTVNTSEF